MNRHNEKSLLLNDLVTNGISYRRGDVNTRSKIGIHLTEPTLLELNNAFSDALKNGFKSIYYYRVRGTKLKLIVDNVNKGALK